MTKKNAIEITIFVILPISISISSVAYFTLNRNLFSLNTYNGKGTKIFISFVLNFIENKTEIYL